MIEPSKHRSALRALNFVLVMARKMAFERAPHETIAKVLDWAEVLPMLMLEEEDRTATFRSYLEALVEIDASFSGALARFDE